MVAGERESAEEVIVWRRGLNTNSKCTVTADARRSSELSRIWSPPEQLFATGKDGSRRTKRIQFAARLARRLPGPSPCARRRYLLDQYHGALESEIEAIRTLLRELQPNIDAAASRLETLLGRASIGLHLVRPWRVTIAGPPNVGKSSLLNALAGFERAIVFDQPGTTRDVLTVLTAIDGWPIELADTAGWRDSERPDRDGRRRTSAASGGPSQISWCWCSMRRSPSPTTTKLSLQVAKCPDRSKQIRPDRIECSIVSACMNY